MKYLKAAVMLTLVLLLAGIRLPVATAQQGPQSQPSETVAKPKKPATPADDTTTTTTDQPPIPSQYKKDKEVPTSLPTFRSDVTAVQVEVSVLDNKGNFNPKIPKGNIRILKDNVPQQI